MLLVALSYFITTAHAALLRGPALSRCEPLRPAARHPPLAAGEISLTDPRLVLVSLERTTGIDFGCDLSLRWPYILALTPDGAAQRSGLLQKGDQLLMIDGATVVGMPIGDIMEKMGAAEGAEIEMLFFRGSREQLQRIAGAAPDQVAAVSITVQQPGQPDELFEVPYGEPYQSSVVLCGAAWRAAV